MQNPTTYTHIKNAIEALGIANSTTCLHASLKSFGFLEGGADTLIQAFLDQGCTLLVPTFTYDCQAPIPQERMIPQNAWVNPHVPERAEPFDPDSPMISKDMGAIPARVLEWQAHVRSIHPLNSFTAIGPLAKRLVEKQSLLDVYAPFKEMYTQPAAYMGLIGVDLTKATAIHFAEERSGRNLFRRWAIDSDGTHQETAVGSCSDGFNRFDPVVKDIEMSITVGQSHWRVYPFKPFIDIVTQAIVDDQSITHCADPKCPRCNDAVRGGPLL